MKSTMRRGAGSIAWTASAALSLGVACGGGGSGESDARSDPPPVVFGGGGGVLELDVSVNRPARFVTGFEQLGADEEIPRELSSVQDLAPGDHHFVVDVSPRTYGYFEVGIPDATVGARIAWTIRLDGEEVIQEADELHAPLPEGRAFFLQLEFDEIAQLKLYARRPPAAASADQLLATTGTTRSAPSGACARSGGPSPSACSPSPRLSSSSSRRAASWRASSRIARSRRRMPSSVSWPASSRSSWPSVATRAM